MKVGLSCYKRCQHMNHANRMREYRNRNNMTKQFVLCSNRKQDQKHKRNVKVGHYVSCNEYMKRTQTGSNVSLKQYLRLCRVLHAICGLRYFAKAEETSFKTYMSSGNTHVACLLQRACHGLLTRRMDWLTGRIVQSEQNEDLTLTMQSLSAYVSWKKLTRSTL